MNQKKLQEKIRNYLQLTETEKEEFINKLDHKERLAVVKGLDAKNALDFILSTKEIYKLVSELPILFNYTLMKEVGIEDSGEIFLFSNKEQCSRYLDIEIWDHDELNISRLENLFTTLASFDKSRTIKKIGEIDEKTLTMWIAEKLIIECKYDGDIEDFVPHQESVTIDNVYYLRPATKDGFHAVLMDYLQTLAGQNLQTYHLLLENSRGLNKTFNIEQMYQEKATQLEDIGLPSFEESLSIYGKDFESKKDKDSDTLSQAIEKQSPIDLDADELLSLIWKVSTVRKLHFHNSRHLTICMKEIKILITLGSHGESLKVDAASLFSKGWQKVIKLQTSVRKMINNFKDKEDTYPWEFIDPKFSKVVYNLYQPYPQVVDFTSEAALIPQSFDGFEVLKNTVSLYDKLFNWIANKEIGYHLSSSNDVISILTTELCLNQLKETSFRAISITELKMLQDKLIIPFLDGKVSIKSLISKAFPGEIFNEAELTILAYMIKNSWEANIKDLDINTGLNPKEIKGILIQGWTH